MVPPPRFDSVRFSTYIPDPNQPSQTEAVRVLEGFAVGLGQEAGGSGKRRLFGFGKAPKKAPAGPRGVYLDGGYGVGKTHLLASLWHATPAEPELKAFGTFVELTNLVGALGFQQTVQTLSGHRLLCIDEFELDDPGDTVLVSTLLGRLVDAGVALAATSNTLPGSVRAGSPPPTSCARSRDCRPTSAPCASTARTTVTAACPRHRRRTPTNR
jgi:cell division protein ZapE